MKLVRKIDVRIRLFPEYDNKEWVEVELLNGRKTWVPSFHDLYDITRAIGDCEDNKYSSPYAKRRFMEAQFIYEAIMKKNISFETLARRFQIPRIGE